MIEQFTFQLCVLERYIINFNIDKFYFIIYFINNILHENSVSCLRNNIII